MGFSSIGMINYFDKIKAEQIRLDEIKNSREEFLLKLDLAGGGSGSSSGKKSAGAAEKAFKMQDRLDKSGITDETTLNYYSNLFKDPLATADAYDFIEDQAKNYDRVVDLTNNEEFYELARKINSMTNQSGRTAFLDINPESIQKTDYTAREKQLDSVRKNVIRTARAGLDNDPDKIETLNALNNLSSSNAGTRDDAEAYLFSRFITPEFIASLEDENQAFYRGLSKHPDLSGYIKSSMATTSQTVVTPPVSTTRVVTQQMANKDRRLRPFVGKEMQFELKDDGQYYPILGD